MKINRALSIVLVALMVVAMLPAFAFASATGTVTITGNSSFVSAPEGTYSKLTYVAAYSDGQAVVTDNPKAFSWKVTENGAPATDVWCVDGEFIVSGGAEGTYNIVATHKATGTKSADFPVTVTTSTVYDWSTKFLSGYNTKNLVTEDGNTYYKAIIDIDCSGDSALNEGVKTVNLKFKVPEGTDTSKHNAYIIRENVDKNSFITATSDTTYYTLPDNTFALTRKGGSWLPLCDVSGNVKALNYDRWYELSVVFDLPDSESGNAEIIGLYLDGEYCKTRLVNKDVIYESVSWEHANTSKLRFGQPSDDIVMYSGEPYSGVIPSSEYTVDGAAFDIDSDTLAVGKTLSYTFSANQIQDTAETYMVVAAKYTADGKELLTADAKDLTTVAGSKISVTVSAEKTEGSIIKVFVFKKADISPVIYNPVK